MRIWACKELRVKHNHTSYLRHPIPTPLVPSGLKDLQSYISKGIWRQGIGYSVRSPMFRHFALSSICPYLCTSDVCVIFVREYCSSTIVVYQLLLWRWFLQNCSNTVCVSQCIDPFRADGYSAEGGAVGGGCSGWGVVSFNQTMCNIV